MLERLVRHRSDRARAVGIDLRPVVAEVGIPPQQASAAFRSTLFGLPLLDRLAVLRDQRLAERRFGRVELTRRDLHPALVDERGGGLGRRARHVVERRLVAVELEPLVAERRVLLELADALLAALVDKLPAALIRALATRPAHALELLARRAELDAFELVALPGVGTAGGGRRKRLVATTAVHQCARASAATSAARGARRAAAA